MLLIDDGVELRGRVRSTLLLQQLGVLTQTAREQRIDVECAQEVLLGEHRLLTSDQKACILKERVRIGLVGLRSRGMMKHRDNK